MKCALCGHQFEETSARASCDGCPMSGACHMVRCPNCGYETPGEPGLIKALKGWRKRIDAARRKG